MTLTLESWHVALTILAVVWGWTLLTLPRRRHLYEVRCHMSLAAFNLACFYAAMRMVMAVFITIATAVAWFFHEISRIPM